jgi:hypothetical protein
MKREAGNPELINDDRCTNNARTESTAAAGIKSWHGDVSGKGNARQH